MMNNNDLLKSVKYIKGVGPKKEELLKNLQIYSVEDVLYSFPREYEDRGIIKKIADLVDTEPATVIGQVIEKKKGRYSRHSKQPFKVMIKDNTGLLELMFFNSAYVDDLLEVGKFYYFYGTPKITFSQSKIIHPEIAEMEDRNAYGIYPIYNLTKGITQKDRRKIEKEALASVGSFEEYLNDTIVINNRLCDINYAMNNIHFPNTMQNMKEAKYRLVFDEFLILQTGLAMIKNKTHLNKRGIKFPDNIKVDDFTEKLPFDLTAAQKKVIHEIIEDMETEKVMNRLLQGDVGSGKTVVAAIAIYKAVKSSYQAVLMAPTEILAKQHLETMNEFFKELDLKVGFISGSSTKKAKAQVLESLKQGEIDLLIGTHALLEEHVVFNNLGLVVTDEQHRFGVKQRTVLEGKGHDPDVLVMTATPIPRTLALIVYGDLDISIIDSLPKGRKEIKTKAIKDNERSIMHKFIMDEIDKGRQGFIVAPLIEDSEAINAKSVESLYEELSSVFLNYKIELLHGKMKQKEKDRLMEAYKNKEIDILVSTVVIEVGINIPNATVMMIENSERFGLAQLHQLRGRVGRGEHQSYCILENNGKGQTAKDRAEIMSKTNDGFIIAEKDLEIRGPGDFFGLRQHGLPEFKIANIFRHIKILKRAQEESIKLLQDDPKLEKDENSRFKVKIERLFNELGRVSL